MSDQPQTPAQHYLYAEALLKQATNVWPAHVEASHLTAMAQVHATLAASDPVNIAYSDAYQRWLNEQGGK